MYMLLWFHILPYKSRGGSLAPFIYLLNTLLYALAISTSLIRSLKSVPSGIRSYCCANLTDAALRVSLGSLLYCNIASAYSGALALSALSSDICLRTDFILPLINQRILLDTYLSSVNSSLTVLFSFL